MALDLAGEVVGRLGHPRGHAGGRATGAQRDALEAQRALGDLAVLDGGVALLAQLDVQDGERRDLTSHLLAALLDALPQLVADHNVAPLYLDAHAALLELAVALLHGWYGPAPTIQSSAPGSTRISDRNDGVRPALAQHSRARGQGRARGYDVVDQHGVRRRAALQPDGARDPGEPLRAVAADLGLARAAPLEAVGQVEPGATRERQCEYRRLVIAAPARPRGMQRHGHERAFTAEPPVRRAGGDLSSHRVGRSCGAPELERAYHPLSRPLVGDGRPCAQAAAERHGFAAQPAQRAAAPRAQRLEEPRGRTATGAQGRGDRIEERTEHGRPSLTRFM